MGKINQGILGGFRGKVGPVVGAAWKGIDYMRGYVIPANPKTAPQVASRTIFGQTSQALSQFLYLSLRPYADKVATRQSGFNLGQQISVDLMSAGLIPAFDSTQMAISAGPVDPVIIISAVRAGSAAAIEWEATSPSDPTGSDLVDLYAVATSNGLLVAKLIGVERVLAGADIPDVPSYDEMTYTVLALAHNNDGTTLQRGSYASSWGIMRGGTTAGIQIVRRNLEEPI